MYIFLDYDGTLVEERSEEFYKLYFKLLSKKSKLPFEKIYNLVMESVNETLENDDENITLFEKFLEIISHKSSIGKNYWLEFFIDFYQNEFNEIKKVTIPKDNIIKKIKKTDHQLIFASNPLFPKIAVEKRISFAGLSPNNFIYISHMENSHFAKPNPKFFKEILNSLNLDPKNCVMIGDSDFDKASELVNIKFIHINETEEWEKYFND
ncbi:MAG: HAD hydrolase-like protein [Thermosipho sp. (in: Bacteria)]|nr:HAD hydrolase-like protein [Thermosipho sp. (in: thermotogales)]